MLCIKEHYQGNEKKINTTGKNVYKSYIWGGSSIQNIQRPLTVWQQKDKQSNFLNGQRAWTDTFPKMIYKWLTKNILGRDEN